MTSAITPKKNAAGAETGLSRAPWQVPGLPSFERMRREFDELFTKLFTDVPTLWNAERGDSRWAFDVEDHPDTYLIKAEAPGFDLKDFHVDLRGNCLVMQARRSDEKKETGKESFSSSEFYHSMTIPEHVDPTNITATYRQGVLQVSLPKTEEGKGRRIEVRG